MTDIQSRVVTRIPLTLPLDLPQPCPICGKKVTLYTVTPYECEPDSDRNTILEYECETEPDSSENYDEWLCWLSSHYSTPHIDWLPWRNRVLEWLNERYYYDGSE